MKNFKSKVVGYIGIAALLFVCSFSAGAQSVEFGVRFMPTFSKFDIQTSSGGRISGEGTLGFGVGALLGFSITKHVGVQAEVIYSNLAQKYKEQDIERQIKLKYFNIPLLLSLNTGKTRIINLNVVAGPQIGISAGSRLLTSNGNGVDSTNAVLAVRKGDLGFAYGVGLDFGLNPARTARLSVGYRGVYGLFDISDDSATLTTESFYVLDRSHIKTNAAYIGFSFLF